MNKFDELRSTFYEVQKRFEQAETLEQKQRLVLISQNLIKAANTEIEEFRKLLRFR